MLNYSEYASFFTPEPTDECININLPGDRFYSFRMAERIHLADGNGTVKISGVIPPINPARQIDRRDKPKIPYKLNNLERNVHFENSPRHS